MPDLLIMDGGKNQVNKALEALNEIGVTLNVIGLVKDDNHKTNAIWYNDREIELDKKSGLFLYLESIQDEVHRFAISFHKDTRSKNMFISKLDSIKGIGKVKKEKILKIVGDDDFIDKLNELSLTDEQKIKVKEIYLKD